MISSASALPHTPSHEHWPRQCSLSSPCLSLRVCGRLRRYYQLSGSFAGACNALQLHKSLRLRMWPDSQQQCRQLPHVGHLTASRLAAAGLGGLRCARELAVLAAG